MDARNNLEVPSRTEFETLMSDTNDMFDIVQSDIDDANSAISTTNTKLNTTNSTVSTYYTRFNNHDHTTYGNTVPIAGGGTGTTTAAQARINLGLDIFRGTEDSSSGIIKFTNFGDFTDQTSLDDFLNNISTYANGTSFIIGHIGIHFAASQAFGWSAGSMIVLEGGPGWGFQLIIGLTGVYHRIASGGGPWGDWYKL